MNYWQAPLAKNTSAMVAINMWSGRKDSDIFLVCLDADNVLAPKHIQKIMDRLVQRHTEPYYKRLVINFNGLDGGVAGQDGYFASAFLKIRGYRQNLNSHGYQDTDLRVRLKKLCLLENEDYKHPQYFAEKMKNIGYSIPNESPGMCWSDAKLLHCPPAERHKFATWGEMTGDNVKIADAEDRKSGWQGVNATLKMFGCHYRNIQVCLLYKQAGISDAEDIANAQTSKHRLEPFASLQIMAQQKASLLPISRSISFYTLGCTLVLQALGRAEDETGNICIDNFIDDPQLAWKNCHYFHFPALDKDNFHILDIDCRDFVDPTDVRENVNHIGLFPSHLLHMLGFQGDSNVCARHQILVRSILEKYARVMMLGAEQIDVVVWCLNGRCCSVAIGALLVHLQVCVFGTNCEVNHLNRLQWMGPLLRLCDQGDDIQPTMCNRCRGLRTMSLH